MNSVNQLVTSSLRLFSDCQFWWSRECTMKQNAQIGSNSRGYVVN